VADHEFDVVVIGAGPAGEVLAGRLARRGERRVAIVERDHVGGECSFYACIPSKALLRPQEVLAEARRIPGAAEAITGGLDISKVLGRRDEVINWLDDAKQLPWLSDRGVALFRGDGRIDGERRVRVGDDVLSARDAVVIATGSTALMPPIPGLAEASAWSNRQITTTTEVPSSLLILGGGVVGVEMAQAWVSLGSKVTIIEALDRLISREEPFAGELVADSLRELGVEVRLGVRATRVTGGAETNSVTVELEDGSSFSGERLLVAIGRKPLTADLGLETVGLEGGGFLDVDDHLRVQGSDWLYAVGDANGRALLTHVGKYQGRIAADHIIGEQGAVAFADRLGAPRVVFTDPQVAAVGPTLAEALEQGAQAVAIDLPTGSSAGANYVGIGAPGTSRFIVDVEREVLLGVTFSGPGVSDFLQAASIAVVAEIPLTTLAHAIAPFPTRLELWLAFLEAYERERGVTVHAARQEAGR